MMLGSVDRWIRNPRVEPFIVFSLALVLYCINLDRSPHPDELHHVLAAQHLLETGRPLIGEGEYWRGILHTWLVAISYETLGEGLASARAPSVLLAASGAAVLFVWVRREAGRLAAWLSAVLFISSPFTIEIAQFSRFYALQLVSFLLGAICVYYAMAATASLRRRLIYCVLALGLLALSTWLQSTSLMGLVGLSVWIFVVMALKFMAELRATQTTRNALVPVLVAAGAFVALATIPSGTIYDVWHQYRRSMLFNAHSQDEFWFYHVRFLIFYPTLWSLVGFLAAFAVVHKARLAWLAIAVFSSSFVLASFAGPKATRYLSFAQPFLAILWGVGLAYLVPTLGRLAEATQIRLSATLALPRRLESMVVVTVVGSAVAIVILMNPFWIRSATMIGDITMPFEKPSSDWRAARAALAPWTSDADIMITTEELGAIYFLGRSDVRYSPSKLLELREDQQFEFGIDYRTGRPVISKPESMRRLIECFDRGLIVGPIEHWGNSNLINEPVQAMLMAHTTPIGVPKESHLYARGWHREPRQTKPDYCADLRRFSARRR